MTFVPKDLSGAEAADDLLHGTLSMEDEARLKMRRWTDPDVLIRRARNGIFKLFKKPQQ
jgi:hypothetical protein